MWSIVTFTEYLLLQCSSGQVGIIEELVSGYLECLRTCQRLDRDSKSLLSLPVQECPISYFNPLPKILS